MGDIHPPKTVKLIFGLIYKENELCDEVFSRMESQWGPVDYKSEAFPFTETEYYEKEMGASLTRQYISLQNLIFPDALPAIKVVSNQWEENLSDQRNRRINIDPGYITTANLVLASTKDFSQRIYLSQGIYAEVTMTYVRGEYIHLPWTYPDYWNHRDVFLEIRKIYMDQLKKRTSSE